MNSAYPEFTFFQLRTDCEKRSRHITRFIRINGRSYRYQEVPPSETLKRLQNPAGTISVACPMILNTTMPGARLGELIEDFRNVLRLTSMPSRGMVVCSYVFAPLVTNVLFLEGTGIGLGSVWDHLGTRDQRSRHNSGLVHLWDIVLCDWLAVHSNSTHSHWLFCFPHSILGARPFGRDCSGPCNGRPRSCLSALRNPPKRSALAVFLAVFC